MVHCASPSGQNQRSCHMVLKRTNLLLFAIYHIPAIHQERLHEEVLKKKCGWTFDKAADTNTETEGLNQQPFSYWTYRFSRHFSSLHRSSNISFHHKIHQNRGTKLQAHAEKKKKNLLTSRVRNTHTLSSWQRAMTMNVFT